MAPPAPATLVKLFWFILLFLLSLVAVALTVKCITGRAWFGWFVVGNEPLVAFSAKGETGLAIPAKSMLVDSTDKNLTTCFMTAPYNKLVTPDIHTLYSIMPLL